MMVYEVQNLLVPSETSLGKYAKKIENAFEAFCRDEVQSFSDEIANPMRHHLDEIVFDILNLNKKEREEVYEAVQNLVRRRLDKARSLGKKSKNRVDAAEFDAAHYAQRILEEAWGAKGKKTFPQDFIEPAWKFDKLELPEEHNDSELQIEEFFGKASLRINGHTLDCGTPARARFVEILFRMGNRGTVGVPKNDKDTVAALRAWDKYRESLAGEIEQTLAMYHLNKRQAKAVMGEMKKLLGDA
jgi:hypothetical protein